MGRPRRYGGLSEAQGAGSIRAAPDAGSRPPQTSRRRSIAHGEADSSGFQTGERRISGAVRDELNEPLGLVSGAAAAPPAGRSRAAGRAVLAAAALAAAIGLVTLARRDSPLDGEPYAVAKVEVAPAPSRPAAPDVTASVHEAAAPPIASADQVEAASGVKVTRPGGGGPPNARIIDVERALADRLNAAPDPRLIETSRTGSLPRVGADGARPFEVYDRRMVLYPQFK